MVRRAEIAQPSVRLGSRSARPAPRPAATCRCPARPRSAPPGRCRPSPAPSGGAAAPSPRRGRPAASSPERSASNRLDDAAFADHPPGRHCGSANPSSVDGAEILGTRTGRRSAAAWLSAITTVPGPASACRRAARFGVSPTAVLLARVAGADQLADHDQPGGDADAHMQRLGRSRVSRRPRRRRRGRPAPPVRHRPRAPPASRNRSARRRPRTWR